MSELFSDAKAILIFVLGVLTSVLAFFTRRAINDIDELKKSRVTREELKDALREMKDERVRMHQQNREDLQYIRARMDSLSKD